MKNKKQIYDEIYQEMIEELTEDELLNKPMNLDEIEGIANRFGDEFKRRIVEKTTRIHRKEIDKKKAVKNADRN
jgi:flagellin-specific chaperone FliS